MDFNQLMSLATQNKAQAQKQKEVKKVVPRSGGKRTSSEGVSGAAVEAFLAKRQKELKHKAAEEEAAKRARIKERLAQSLGTNKKLVDRKAATKGQSGQTAGERYKSDQINQQIPCKTSATNRERTSTMGEKNSGSNSSSVKSLPRQRNVKKQEVNGLKKPLGFNSNKVKTVQKMKEGAKKSGPMNFKDLLAAAEKNKNGESTSNERELKVKSGLAKVTKNVEHGNRTVRKQDTIQERNNLQRTQKESQVTNDRNRKSLKDGNTNGKDSQRSLQLKGGGKVRGMQPMTSAADISSKGVGRTSKPADSHPGNQRRPVSSKERHFGRQRDQEMLKRKRDPYEEEMDDFIDDGAEDNVDVSRYIKEIFGYDKSRYVDDDADLSNMESNYSQIEKEEYKSARIARLEDEIEHLKELAELKKQKQKMKKRLKT